MTQLWAPTAERVARANITKFKDALGMPGASYEAVHRLSIDEPARFWAQVWKTCGVVGDIGTTTVVCNDPMIYNHRFFPESKLSVVQNLLRFSGQQEAVVAINEAGDRRSLTWDQLRQQVGLVAGHLEALGVQEHDRVAAWLPNSIEALIVMLASASLGAIYTSTSPDFGTEGVLDRFSQVQPKVLFAVDSYTYGGKSFDCLERLTQIAQGLPSPTAIVVVKGPLDQGKISDSRAITFEQLLSRPVDAVAPRRFDFDHPWYILYSSGTTGMPKCIVHRTGGVLLQHLKEHQLHCDVLPNDKIMYFTTTGWMMWNWLVSGLGSGATIVLFDGNPGFPDLGRLFDIVDTESISLLGVSAKFIDSLNKAGFRPGQTHALDSLRTICSTGSPLTPEGFEYVYENIKQDLHLASISGGTDLCGCLVAGDPASPVYSGEIQHFALGLDIDTVDEQGRQVRNQPGDLVCRNAFPSMPLTFWGSDGDERYHDAYFSKYPGMWAHGDFASVSETGGIVIHGRSDATLNPGGIRIGTSEIYRVVEAIDSVHESLAVGRTHGADVEVILLVKLAPDQSLSPELVAQIKSSIRQGCTPRHVPKLVVQVEDLPKTRSGKLVELAVADAINGRPVRNTSGIANPESITAIMNAIASHPS